MNHPAENDVIAIVTHLRRLLDPARSTRAQAESIVELAPAVCETLTTMYGLDDRAVMLAVERAFAAESKTH